MKAEDFVGFWKKEKDNILKIYSDKTQSTCVSSTLESLNLDSEEETKILEMIDGVLTDTFYSLLLGLDGSASIGGHQETFKVYDESGELVSECGEIEAEAWEQFQENQ